MFLNERNRRRGQDLFTDRVPVRWKCLISVGSVSCGRQRDLWNGKEAASFETDSCQFSFIFYSLISVRNLVLPRVWALFVVIVLLVCSKTKARNMTISLNNLNIGGLN